jgi:hypothetical protein
LKRPASLETLIFVRIKLINQTAMMTLGISAINQLME